jgi:hypothetical protein
MDEAEVVQCEGFTGTVAGVAEDRDGVLVVVGGLLILALVPVADADIGQRVGFGGSIPGVLGCVQGVRVDAQGIWVVVTEFNTAQ